MPRDSSAKDKGTGKEQSITITGGGSLSDEEISRMVDEAAANAEDDKAKIAIITQRNQLDTLIYQTDKAVNENSEKLSEETTANLKAKVEAGRLALDSDDLPTLEGAYKELESALHSASGELYAAAEPAQDQPAGEGAGSSGDDDVVDADFEDVADNAS